MIGTEVPVLGGATHAVHELPATSADAAAYALAVHKRAFEQHPQLHDYMNSITSLGRVGVPDDIGGIIAFLCTEDARWINAQRIEASGGMFL